MALSGKRTSERVPEEANRIIERDTVIRDLTGFGQTTICNDWLRQWATHDLSRSSPDETVQGSAAIILFNHAIELARAVVLLQVGGMDYSALGLVAPTYSVLRSQMESYWNLHYLISDPNLRQRNCASYIYCYNMLRYRQNTSAIDKDKTLTETQRKQRKSNEDTLKNQMRRSPTHAEVKVAYTAATNQTNRGAKYPVWYQICPDPKFGHIETVSDLAKVCGHEEQELYYRRYGDWSAVAHGHMPVLGINTGEQGPAGSVVHGPNLTEVWLMAGYCIEQLVKASRLVVKTLVPNHEIELETLINRQVPASWVK